MPLLLVITAVVALLFVACSPDGASDESPSDPVPAQTQDYDSTDPDSSYEDVPDSTYTQGYDAPMLSAGECEERGGTIVLMGDVDGDGDEDWMCT